jgi:hypothetical protein
MAPDLHYLTVCRPADRRPVGPLVIVPAYVVSVLTFLFQDDVYFGSGTLILPSSFPRLVRKPGRSNSGTNYPQLCRRLGQFIRVPESNSQKRYQYNSAARRACGRDLQDS